MENISGWLAQQTEMAKVRINTARSEADALEERSRALREQILADRGFLTALFETEKVLGPPGDDTA